MTRKSGKGALIVLLLFSLALGGYTLLNGALLNLRSAAGEQAGAAGMLRALAASVRPADLALALAAAGAAFGASLALIRGKTRWAETLYRRRYLLSLLLVIAVTALKWNNTSLFRWMMEVDQAGAEAWAPLWGMPRGIRSDEWAVWSVFTVSQAAKGFPAVNPLIGGGADTAWISVGGIPAWSPAAVFKPLYWGFLTLGLERGYSLLFALRTLGLFHMTQELALLYTGGKRRWSVTAAFLVTFSPYVQWWFSQSPAEVLIFGQGMLLCLEKYLKARGGAGRWGWGALGAWFMGCYAMVAYPSWLISGLYVILPMAIGRTVRGRAALRRGGWLPGTVCLAAAAGALLALLVGSADTLRAVMNSVYPGARVMTGGNPSPGLYSGAFSLLLPFIQKAGFNPSEYAGFALLPGLGLILTVYAWIRRYGKGEKTGIGKAFGRVLKGACSGDLPGLLLTAAELFLGCFAVLGFPAPLARATLLFQVNRPELALGMADTVLLIRACAALSGERKAKHVPRRAVPCVLCILALLGGAFVNPVQAGLDCVKELTPVRAIQALAEKDGTEEVWLAEDAWPWTNLPLLAGQKTAGCTQPYPDPEYWRAADPEGIYTDAYNRFCNISVSLTETEPTAFSNPAEDQLEVRLNLSDLKKLGVTRLMTRREWPERSGGCAFELLDTEGEFRFYAVSWEE